MKKLFFYFVTLLILVSCSSKKVIFTVENIKDVKNYKQNPLIYALPKTVILVDVEITKKSYKKGKFSDYAAQNLGISNVIEKDKSEWSISNVKINTFAKVDTTQIYVINSNSENLSNLINLSKEGFLLGFNKQIESYNTDIEINNYLINEILQDTTFAKVSFLEDQLKTTDINTQAQTLAKSILKLRDDRKALISGDEALTSDGEAFNAMLNSLDKLEEEYLSMFVGKSFETTQSYHFEFVPEENQQFRQEILFKFSETDGFLAATSLKGKPVYLEIESEKYTNIMSDFTKNQALAKRTEKIKDKNSGIVYRVPEKTKVKLTYLSKELSTENILISQYGANVRIPINLIFNKDYSIEFYPNYGALKSIEKANK